MTPFGSCGPGRSTPDAVSSEAQHVDAVLVGDERHERAVGRELEPVHVPRDGARQDRLLAGREVEAHEPRELRALVGHDEERLAVLRELRRLVRDLLGGLRRQQLLAAGGCVDEPQVRLVRRDPLAEDERLVVGGEVLDAPAAALDLRHEPVGLRVFGVHDVDIAVLAGAPRRAVGDAIAGGRPHRAGVARLAVGEQRDLAGRAHEAVELVELAAARVLGEDERVAVFGAVRGARHAVREERQLRARRARRLDLVHLRRVAEAGDDEHLAPRRVPGVEGGRTQLRVAAGRRRDLGRDLRDAVGHQVLVRDHLARLRRQQRRRQQHRAGQQYFYPLHPWLSLFEVAKFRWCRLGRAPAKV